MVLCQIKNKEIALWPRINKTFTESRIKMNAVYNHTNFYVSM